MWRWFRTALILLLASCAFVVMNPLVSIAQHDQNSPVLKRINQSKPEFDSEGYLVKLWMPQFRGINFFGQLSDFERLKNLEVEYSGHIYNYSLNGVGLLKNLESLRLRYADEIDHESLLALQTLPKLKELSLSHTYALNEISAFVDFASLKRLQLEVTNFNWGSLAERDAQKRMPIEELRFIGTNNIKHSDWEIIAQFPKLRVLTLVDDQELADVALKTLAIATGLKSLHIVNCNSVTGEFLQNFTNSSLEELTLVSSKARPEVLDQIAEIDTLRRLKLKFGVVGRRQRSEEGVAPSSKLGRLTKLEELDIDSTQFGLGVVAPLSETSNLRTLSFKFYRGISASERQVDWLGSFPKLEALRLSGAKPFPALWLKSFQHPHSSIQELILENCQLDDEAIEQLSNCHSLRRLALVNCGMTSGRLEKVTKLSSLNVLDLQNNPDISDDGLKQIAKFPELKRLRLSGCKLMTGSGFEEFDVDHPLETIAMIRMNSMTPAGLELLLKLKNLREFSFHSEKITREHFLTLRCTPDLEVVQMEPKQDLDSVFSWELDEIQPEINRGVKVINWNQYFSLLSDSLSEVRESEAMDD
ncbi:MAG: hypothetical protein KF851_15335 [Pirellulaceae bacterium]|nr:hypothetical protein [Pirellulaceae bacterium]